MTRLIVNADAAGNIPPDQAKQIREFVASRRARNASYIDADARQEAAEEELGRVV